MSKQQPDQTILRKCLTRLYTLSMSTQDDDESIHSTFSDGDGSNSIDLCKLELAVGKILGIQCTLRKLTEGGNHKVCGYINLR